MLTSYDMLTAALFEEAGIPVLLVGDSAGNNVLGYSTTVPVTVDELLPMVRAVVRSTTRPLVVADLPFGSYQGSPEQALATAVRFLKEGGAQAVKLEGGVRVAPQVELLVQAGVAGHGARRPDAAVRAGHGPARAGPRRGGATGSSPTRSRCRTAGAFAVVLEAVPADLAERVTKELDDPHHRHRRRRRLRRAGAGLDRHGRPHAGRAAHLRQALRRPARHAARRHAASTPTTSARAASPAPSTASTERAPGAAEHRRRVTHDRQRHSRGRRGSLRRCRAPETSSAGTVPSRPGGRRAEPGGQGHATPVARPVPVDGGGEQRRAPTSGRVARAGAEGRRCRRVLAPRRAPRRRRRTPSSAEGRRHAGSTAAGRRRSGARPAAASRARGPGATARRRRSEGRRHDRAGPAPGASRPRCSWLMLCRTGSKPVGRARPRRPEARGRAR